MALCCSNLAWGPERDDELGAVMRQWGIACVDICPTKYFPTLAAGDEIGARSVAQVRDAWHARGLSVRALQSLFFGTTGLNLFGDGAAQRRMVAHLGNVARIGRLLGAKVLVFGSPKQRDPREASLRDAAQIWAHASRFFHQAASRVAAEGLVLALEANTPAVGCAFVTTHSEALALVCEVSHPAMQLHLDVATLITAGEEPETLVPAVLPHLAHVHASEPGFGTLRRHGEVHRRVAAALAGHGFDGAVALEMLPQELPQQRAGLPDAIADFAALYRVLVQPERSRAEK